MSSKRILMCTYCLNHYCRNCSDANFPDDYCSKSCELEEELVAMDEDNLDDAGEVDTR